MSIKKLFDRFRARQDPAAQMPVPHEPEYLTSLPAPTDGDYPLRAEQEEQLYQALRRPGRHILLHGPGGMGKTHMARKLFYRLRRDYKRLAWVEYGMDIRMSMTIPRKDDTEDNPEVRFARFIQKLEEAEQDTILFIDDVKEDAMDDAVLSQITGMGITILMTSRCASISPYETWELAPVTSEECAALFYANYAGDPDKKYLKTVLTLADRLEQNVFAMLLLANVAGDPSNLLRLAKHTRNGSLMDHIGQLLEFAQLTGEQQHILQCLSLMNSGEILESLVGWFDFQASDVEALVDKGWLVRNEDAKCLILHDLVREYYARSPASRCAVEAFIRGALGENFNASVKDNASAEFKRRVLEFQVRALAVMEASGGSKTDLARAYNNVGHTFGDFGNHRKALEYNLKALEIRKEVFPPENQDLATSYNNLGVTYDNLGNPQKALEYKLMALEILEKLLPADHISLAMSYNNVGMSYSDLGDHERALEYALKALEIKEQSLDADHPSLATSYNNVGVTYDRLGYYRQALEYKQKALELRERVLPRDHPDLATSYNNIGYTYGKLGDLDRKMEYYRKALAIREEVLPENHPQIAASCNNIAYAYSDAGQYEMALEWMRRALDIAQRSLPEEHPSRQNYLKAVEQLKKRTGN